MTPQKADGELELNFKHLSRWSQPVLEVRAKELSWGSRRPWAPGLHRQPFAMQVWLSLWALNHFDLCEALNHFDLCEDKEEVGREVASCLTLLKKQVKRRITTGGKELGLAALWEKGQRAHNGHPEYVQGYSPLGKVT